MMASSVCITRVMILVVGYGSMMVGVGKKKKEGTIVEGGAGLCNLWILCLFLIEDGGGDM